MPLQTAPRNAPGPAVDPLVEHLEHIVNARTNGMVRELRVDLYPGEVVLHGRARTYYTKQLATHAVFDAVKGRTLTNNIHVG